MIRAPSEPAMGNLPVAAPTRRQVFRLPIAVALMLALALHIRLLYRSPVGMPRAPSPSGSIAVRIVKPAGAVESSVTSNDAKPIAQPATPITRLTLAAPRAASASASTVLVTAAPAVSAPTPLVPAPVTTASSVVPKAAASIASNAFSIATGARSTAFSMGRLLDLLGVPLEAGNNAPDRAYTGANTLPPAPDYLDDQQYETGPQPRVDIALAYPEQGAGRSGTVLLRLLIGESGAVDNVGIIKSTPPDVFDDAAIAAFMAATFEPATVRGAAVKSQITIEVEFAPTERDNP